MTVLYNNTVCMRVCILLTCGKDLGDRIISQMEEIWAHKGTVTQPLFSEVPVQV